MFDKNTWNDLIAFIFLVCIAVYLSLYVHMCVFLSRSIFRVGREIANGPRDQGSIPGQVIPKNSKNSFLNSLCYKVSIKGKLEQPRERSSTLPYTSV